MRCNRSSCPLVLVILVGLFAMQSRGTAHIGRLFGPVMVLWFVVLAVLGADLDPASAAASWRRSIRGTRCELFTHEPWTAFVSLGSVVLAVTGCEALYADMGHFGRRPIQFAWFCLRAAGAAAQLFRPGRGAAARIRNQAPVAFYAVAPQWAHFPLVLLATIAGIIAIAGGDLRRLLDDAPGRAARPAAAHGDPPHLRHRIRTDLRAAHERAALRRRGADRADLQELPTRWPRLTASRSPASW